MTTFATTDTLTPKASCLSKAATIFVYTHYSASSLVTAFDDAKAKRGTPRGVLTDQEQDILRAALVMACAGLDAALKQAIRDSLEPLLEKDTQVRNGFEDFIRKSLGGEANALESRGGTRFLASVLADKEPRRRLVEEYIKELTGDSLQSAEELFRTAAALGLDHKAVGLDHTRLKGIFDIRNKIIHDLDIDLAARVRKRKVRSQSDLLDNCDHILSTTKHLIEHIDAKI